MTREERIVRDELAALASDARGRRLLQLALRGIQESGRGLATGCWVKRGGGFDALEKRRFRRFQRTGRLGLPWRRLDENAWSAAVERMLIDVLAAAPLSADPRPAGIRA